MVFKAVKALLYTPAGLVLNAYVDGFISSPDAPLGQSARNLPEIEGSQRCNWLSCCSNRSSPLKVSQWSSIRVSGDFWIACEVV